MPIQLRKGDTWYGGIDKPALVSWEAIGTALEGMGLRLLDHFERDEKPLPFDPTKLAPYDDDWDEVAIVRVERGQELDVPDRIKWTKNTAREIHSSSSGAEAGESADMAAEAASRRAAEARARSNRNLAILSVLTGLLSIAAAAAMAKRRHR